MKVKAGTLDRTWLFLLRNLFPSDPSQARVGSNRSTPTPPPMTPAKAPSRDGARGGSGRWCDTFMLASTRLLFTKTMCTAILAQGGAWYGGSRHTQCSFSPVSSGVGGGENPLAPAGSLFSRDAHTHEAGTPSHLWIPGCADDQELRPGR